MEVITGVPAEAVNQGATHTLFVEGTADSIDPRALTRLLGDTDIGIRTLGPSFHVKSAAQALHPYHPNYYFLIDRDHHDDTTVEQSWANFPVADTYNLLIWRKRELENYFLDPGYLSQSGFMKKCTLADLTSRLLKISSRRVFFDIANQTIVKVREVQKNKWIEDFKNPDEFSTSENALEKLKMSEPLRSRASLIVEQMNFASVEKIFKELENEFLGGAKKPELGRGLWLDRMRGKQIFASIVSECFDVKDTDGKTVTGPKAINYVAEDLLRQDLAQQPSDFKELHALISARVKVK
ncbi:MAG: hypothetical protein P4L53_07145 [Candidatus Obscuribacterales bacterium]|nr:hypothetical protein [Candidatus Obscuribacterales bacterium]